MRYHQEMKRDCIRKSIFFSWIGLDEKKDGMISGTRKKRSYFSWTLSKNKKILKDNEK